MRRQSRRAAPPRDAALLALNRWMRDFTTIARVALAELRELRDQLGVSAPGGR